MAAMARNISKDWTYLYERLFSKLSDEGFHDMWSIGGFLVVFIFCTIVITLTLAVIFSWCCGWCFEQPILGSSKISVLLSPPELSRQKSMQTQAPSLSKQSLSRQKSMQTQTPSLSKQSLSRQKSMQTQAPSLSNQSLSRRISTSRSMMDPKHPIESVWSPESVPDVQKTEKSSKNKKLKAGSAKVKSKIQPASRIVRNRDVPV
ncbi:uncharacterized protein LOC118941080 [Oncorhynchus mykiss]|uniref:uncharacterized protein LOC118941080 n=1 Tax=Oncorhynchus mykiss TaxID=8022 RepID=UPI00187761E8|nr:uncharacterized protein LOC118941080 [Oncorhynchus mykiss]XP_036807449.1 uncharacterized protein LOC118941080 [Oncorhynchus mykiss]